MAELSQTFPERLMLHWIPLSAEEQLIELVCVLGALVRVLQQQPSGRRRHSAMVIASETSSVLMCLCMDQPTTIRE